MGGESIRGTYVKSLPYFLKAATPVQESFPVHGRAGCMTPPLTPTWDWAGICAGGSTPTRGAHPLPVLGPPGRNMHVKAPCPPSWAPLQLDAAESRRARPCDSLNGMVRHLPRGDSWKPPPPAQSKVQVSASGSGLTDVRGEHLGPSQDKCFSKINKCTFNAWLTVSFRSSSILAKRLRSDQRQGF